MKQLLFVFVSGLLLMACQQPDVVPDPHQQPTDSASVLKQLKITWDSTDFQEVHYNSQGLPTTYTTQYLYVQGTDIVQRRQYQFVYEARNHLQTITIVGGGFISYSNNGNLVKQTQEFGPTGKSVMLCLFHYDTQNRLVQLDQESSAGTLRYVYSYSGANLSQIKNYWDANASGNYTLSSIIEFTNYDDKKHVENLQMTYPYLPNVVFRKNNPGTRITRDPDGREIHHETYTYTYNAQGYPTHKITTGPGGPLRATYTY